MPAPTDLSGQNGSGQILHLPVRSRTLSLEEAAIHLGLPQRRLRLLTHLGGGPQRAPSSRGKVTYRREDLEKYISELYEKADISGNEMSRRRSASAPARQVAIENLNTSSPDAGQAPVDPFMLMATSGELSRQSVFFVLKVLAIFGFIMLCISPTPLLRTHFN
ncbi:hypothetical protein [Gluconobacter morbifer]|uniref:Helix-turn-helix domain-containing protein n=1 Tax=Gluconobacter morbifer G707 TaxID=1088869 RepID=G6XLX0_9PROT|nr:hypothetical protein [Gluconobacter morbifer]EHH67375.1 hypothetical protein GMO_23700 [Gluconobacter morbifer G707]